MLPISQEGHRVHTGDIVYRLFLGHGLQVRVKGIVDWSLEAQDKSVVVAVVNGEFTVKRIKKEHGRVRLMPENKNYQPMEMLEGSELEIWGGVTNVIHALG